MAKAVSQRTTLVARAKSVARRQLAQALPYLLPTTLLLFLFDLWPIFFGFYVSLWRWGVKAERFVGLANYQRILTEGFITTSPDGQLVPGDVGGSLLVSAYFAAIVVPVSLFLSFLVANLLFQKLGLRALYRTVFFLPYVTSQVAAAMVFKWIFHPNVGVANAGLKALGLPPQRWLLDPDPVLKKLLGAVGVPMDWLPDALAGPSLALLCVILFSIWSAIGFDVVIFLAGLGSIPRELYEAARVDGAQGWRLTRHITLPLLSPTIFFLLVVSIIRSFQAFSGFYAMVGGEGNPLGTTMAITLLIFRNFYNLPGRVGYAAAISFVLFFIILGLTVLQFRVGERKVHYS